MLFTAINDVTKLVEKNSRKIWTGGDDNRLEFLVFVSKNDFSGGKHEVRRLPKGRL